MFFKTIGNYLEQQFPEMLFQIVTSHLKGSTPENGTREVVFIRKYETVA